MLPDTTPLLSSHLGLTGGVAEMVQRLGGLKRRKKTDSNWIRGVAAYTEQRAVQQLTAVRRNLVLTRELHV